VADLRNTVTTIFKADTSQAKAGVIGLRGAERDRAKELLDNLNKENLSLEASIAKWAKVGVAIAGVVGAYKTLSVAAKSYLEDVRLESAAAGANVAGLQKATRGLVEEDKLLAFAGKTMHGVWKLNQQEMETVLKGAMALRKTMGVELSPTIEKLTDAIGKGNVGALKEFGIQAKDKEGVLRNMAALWKEAGGNADMAGDDFQRATVNWRDSVNDLMSSIGKLVVSLEPLFNMLAKVVGTVTEVMDIINAPRERAGMTLNFLADVLRKQGTDATGVNAWGLSEGADFGAFGRNAVQSALARGQGRAAMTAWRQIFDDFDRTYAGIGLKAWNDWKSTMKWKGRFHGAGKGNEITTVLGNQYGMGFDGARFGPGADPVTGVGGGLGAGGIDQVDLTGFTAAEQAKKVQELARIAREANTIIAAQERAAKKNKLFESIFGRPSDIDAYAAAITMAATAVDGLANSFAAAFEAAVTGSDGAISAFKKVAGGAVHAIGQELAVVGAKEAIMALVSLATFDFRGAGLHGAASGAAFAGSAAAFVTANALGYGGGKPSIPSAGAARAGGPGTGAGRSSSAGDQSNQTVVMLGGDWGMLTSLEQKQLLHSAIQLGKNRGGTTDRIRRG
jgi:hypothetical protein